MRGREWKQFLLDRADRETDGSNLRRRQVQEKVYIRWESLGRVVSCGKGARGGDWRPRGEGGCDEWKEVGGAVRGVEDEPWERKGGAQGRGV